MTETDTRYLKALGARILSEANDLKRTPEALAADLDVPADVVLAAVAGDADKETAQQLIYKMTSHYPVSLSDLWLDEDDTDSGVRIMTAAESESSSRVFDRPSAAGDRAPYYEYRDTAMSRLGPYRPEWIKQLRSVRDDDPDNPDVVYNNGHLMHQATFFVGEVNFYWEIDGKRHAAQMNTGDSCYITPFVPHTFTSRNPDQPGLILAVTYGDAVRQATGKMSRLDGAALSELAGGNGAGSSFTVRLTRQLAAESLDATQLSVRASMLEARVSDLLAGASPEPDEVAALAAALSIRVTDLGGAEEAAAPVVVRMSRETEAREYPAGNKPSYRMKELARSPAQPGMKGFDISVLANTDEPAPIRHSLHEYVFVYGEAPVTLHWGDGRSRRLMPGDSAYIAPFVPHAMSVEDAAGDVLSIRLTGALTDTVLDELCTYAPGGVLRTIEESTRWF